MVIVQVIPHLVHDCLLLEAGTHPRGYRQLAGLGELLLHESVTFGEHGLFQLDTDYFAQLFRIEGNIMILAIVNLCVVADQIDVRQQLL